MSYNVFTDRGMLLPVPPTAIVPMETTVNDDNAAVCMHVRYLLTSSVPIVILKISITIAISSGGVADAVTT